MFIKVLKNIVKSINNLRFDNTDNIKIARKKGIQIGSDCRIYSNVKFGSEPYLITIGNHVTITNNVQFITHDGGVWVLRDKYPQIDRVAPIIIKDNCFIGVNSIILPGVTIGENSIIAAGSVVTKDVLPNSVCGGVPARLIRTLKDYEEKILPSADMIKNLTVSEKEIYLKKKYEVKRNDNQI